MIRGIEEALQLEAKRVAIEREIHYVSESLIPEFVPFDGPLPKSMQEFSELHANYRKQLSEQPEFIKDLMNLDALRTEAREHDAREAVRLEILKDLPVQHLEEFNALPADEREELTDKMTSEQRNALVGTLPLEKEPGREGFL